MTHFFEHTQQNLSNTNQVENLAIEVSDAFDKVEDYLHQDDNFNSSLTSSIGNLDNSYIKEYLPNGGYISDYVQPLYFHTNSQSATLDLYPSIALQDLNAVTVIDLLDSEATFIYKNDGVLTESTHFTFVDRKVIFFDTEIHTRDLQITYKGFNTTSNDNDPFELKYNVLRVDGEKNFTYTTDDELITVSGYDFRDMCSSFVQNIIDNSPEDLTKYVAVYNEAGERLSISDVEITNNYFRFILDTDSSSVTEYINIYVANASLGKLIECLYKLFYTHDHGSNGGQGVSHKDLHSLYANTDTIQYQATALQNYDHPQYFNREGFISDTSVYNNAILGDVLLASTNDTNRRNNLEANSVKLIFGDYNSGTQVYYNSNDDCVWVDSISRDGIKLVAGLDKRILSLNDHSFVDTKHVTNNTNRALKISIQSNNNRELGVLKLTRKLDDGVEITEDDNVVLLSYSSEFSLSLIKDTLIIGDNAKLNFGENGIISIYLDDTGLHFNSTDDGTVTDLVKVNFDIPLNAGNISVEHLDASSIHLQEDKRIVFGSSSHTETYDQYINYSANQLKVKATNAVNIANNGRKTGLTLDGRHYIYAATSQGYSITDRIEYTDLFVESKRDTYFIQTDYDYVAGVTSLHTVPRSNIYCGINYANNVSIVYDDTTTNGIILNSNNKIYAQRDLSENISTILQSNNGVIIASSYSPTGPTLNYGKITARNFYAIGDKDTDAGFVGNILVPANHKMTLNGVVEFNNDITFIKTATFQDKLIADTIDAQEVNTKKLYVEDLATYNNIEVLEELRFNTLLQTNRAATSVFEGTVEFDNNVRIPDSNNILVIGSQDIENTRQTSGLLLKHNEVKLGTNGIVSSGKVFANKGTPSGNGDNTGGYSFTSINGELDGDTGLFCENNIEEQNNSDLVFRIDGQERARIIKEDIDFTSLDLTDSTKVLVTLDMLLEQINTISSNVLETTYPIGTIYENSVDSRNPKEVLNWPTSVWRRYAVGRSLIGAEGVSAEDTVTNKPSGLDLRVSGLKYGSYTHTLTVEQLPKHQFEVDAVATDSPGTARPSFNFTSDGPASVYTNYVGNDEPHNITHPVIVTHIWERIG